MRRTLGALLIAIFLVGLFAYQVLSQPVQGFGPVYDATNQALRVNTVAGSASGGTSSNFGTVFPGTGTAIGVKGADGSMASMTLSNSGNLNVNIAEGGGAGGTSSSFGTAFPSAGTAAGFRAPSGAMASPSSDNLGRLHVIIGSPTTANQGASATIANAWPFVTVTDAGVMVRPGDDDNKAIRVRTVASDVASGGTSSNFGTAFPTSGTASGFKGPAGGMASASVDNSDRLLVIVASPVTANAGSGTFTVGGTVTADQGAGGTPWNARTTSDSTLTATVTQANASSLNATVAQGAAGTPWNARVTSDSTITATVTQTTAANLNALVAQGAAGTPWNARTTSDSTITATVTQSNASNLNATVAQGASGTIANAWPVVQVDDAGVMVRAGDATNKAMRVNVVAGAAGGTSSNFGTAFPAAGTAVGFKGPSGSMASASVDNSDRLLVIVASDVTANVASNSFVNVAKFGNNPVVTGVGTGGAGVPRVTVASDSQGNAGDNQAVGERLTYSGGRGSGNAMAFLRCDQFASISTANSGNWLLAASAASQNVYVCGYTFVASGPVIIKFVEGKTAAGRFDPSCSKDSVDLTGQMYIAASGGVVNSVGITPIMRTTTNTGLCINLSDGKTVGGHISYTRF